MVPAIPAWLSVDELLSRLESALGDRYEIIRLVGEGGMARVYLAQDLRHGRQVALKMLRPEIGAAVVGTDRFLREIRIIAGLQHPNILPLFDSGAAPRAGTGADGLWFVMPYVEGESLRARLGARAAFPSRKCSASAGTSPARSTTRTPAAWCTATSSRRTFCSPTDMRSWPISALPGRWTWPDPRAAPPQSGSPWELLRT